jgi:adenylate kinase
MAASDKPKTEQTVVQAVAASAMKDIEAIKANHKDEIVSLKEALATAVKQASHEVEILKKLTKQASKDAEKLLQRAVRDAEKLLQKAARDAEKLRLEAAGKQVSRNKVDMQIVVKKTAAGKKKPAKKKPAKKKVARKKVGAKKKAAKK